MFPKVKALSLPNGEHDRGPFVSPLFPLFREPFDSSTLEHITNCFTFFAFSVTKGSPPPAGTHHSGSDTAYGGENIKLDFRSREQSRD